MHQYIHYVQLVLSILQVNDMIEFITEIISIPPKIITAIHTLVAAVPSGQHFEILGNISITISK